MEDHGYNLRQRSFPVTISERSSLSISTTVTADSLATIAPGTGVARAPTINRLRAALNINRNSIPARIS